MPTLRVLALTCPVDHFTIIPPPKTALSKVMRNSTWIPLQVLHLLTLVDLRLWVGPEGQTEAGSPGLHVDTSARLEAGLW